MIKTLVIGPSWLGDMIMSQILFKILHQQNRIIDVIAPKWNHGILDCMPEVNRAIEMPFDHGDLKLKERYYFAQQLKKYQYDECIVIPNSFKSALIPYWAGIPKRIGWLGECRYKVLTHKQRLKASVLPLMAQRIAALAYMDKNLDQQQMAKLEYPYPHLNMSQHIITSTLNKFDLDIAQKVLILAPGAAFGEAKKWPAEYFATVANEKLQQGWQVWLLGSGKDKIATDEVNSKTNDQCKNLAGLLALPETVAIISQANVVISNDSGLLHVAAALNIPLVGIYGSTSPGFTPPLIAEDKKAILSVKDLACRPCFQKTCKYGHYKCLTEIKPREVTDVIENLL